MEVELPPAAVAMLNEFKKLADHHQRVVAERLLLQLKHKVCYQLVFLCFFCKRKHHFEDPK
jgi:hypothetical protein